MRLTLLTPIELRSLAGFGPDGPIDQAAMAECLRSHAWLLGPIQRRVLLNRTQQFLMPLFGESQSMRSELESILRTLVALGDVVGDGAVVSPAPLRAVNLGSIGEAGRWLLLGGPPTKRLGLQTESPGLRVVRTRTQTDAQKLASCVASEAGRVVLLGQWCGTSRSLLDLTWIQEERRRLERAVLPIRAERGQDIRTYVPAHPRPWPNARWRTPGPNFTGSALVDLRAHGSYGPFGWGRFSQGELTSFASLPRDRATELSYALDVEAQNPSTVQLERQSDGSMAVRAPFLPRAEWRVLAALSFLRRGSTAGSFHFDLDEANWVMALLAERLGVRVVRTDTGQAS